LAFGGADAAFLVNDFSLLCRLGKRAGQCWCRVPATPKTIMSALGPVTYSRTCYRHSAERALLMPVDEGLELVNEYLTRPPARPPPADDEGGHGTAREAEPFFPEIANLTASTAPGTHSWAGSIPPQTTATSPATNPGSP